MQMRKLKKQGYTFYVIGQLLPYITTILFIGSKMFTSTMAMVFMGISILFIILYTVQRKHLVY
jgi:hypothetical protein